MACFKSAFNAQSPFSTAPGEDCVWVDGVKFSYPVYVSFAAGDGTGEPYDGLVLSVDGQDVTEIIGGELDWRRMTSPVAGDGLHCIEWRYEKYKRDSAGEDCAWLDALVAPKQAGAQGFYKVWVSDAPILVE